MEIKQIRNIIESEMNLEKKKNEELKDNISSSYLLAQMDFITIENREDCIDTYNSIINLLDDLQQRIISRNMREKKLK